MRKILMPLMAAWIFSGCTVHGSGKAALPSWKVYTDKTDLDFPPTAWNRGSLRYELTSVVYEKRYTVLKVQSYGMRFHFKVKNQGSGEADVFQSMAKGSLTFQDGTFIDRLVWVAGKVKLEPGKETDGQYFTDNTIPEGSRPKRLDMEGSRVAGW